MRMNKKFPNTFAKLFKWLKKYWHVILGVVFILVLLMLYLCTFHAGFSDEHSRWGEFGSFFGSLTGLLAFIGVIITQIQSREQILGSEERETFFSLLAIFREHRNNVVIEQASLVPTQWGKERQSDKKTIQGDAAFAQIGKESNYHFLEAIISKAPDNISEEEIMNCLSSEQDNESMKTAIEELYFNKKTLNIACLDPITIGNHIQEQLAYFIIRVYVKKEKYDALASAMKEAGDKIYSLYKNQLGPYHRNVFYLFNIISEYVKKKTYERLFRAQLSKDELIVIFFNSFSNESNPTARKYYFSADLFNNLTWEEVGIPQDTRSVGDKLLKSLYTAADAK